MGHWTTRSHSWTLATQFPWGHLTGWASGQEVLVLHWDLCETHFPSQQWYWPGWQILTTHCSLDSAQE